ncbi:unnamed protein product [Leptidea sinapis]|uniref:Uncharacterized protein n=1 Tax=Leptidea sinapis TaxID=189913 RepID=A0A5E4QXY7_9NEOP|nr:unnamed protein product [Leptidea sinapis]
MASKSVIIFALIACVLTLTTDASGPLRRYVVYPETPDTNVGPNYSSNQVIAEDSAVNNIGQGIASEIYSLENGVKVSDYLRSHRMRINCDY